MSRVPAMLQLHDLDLMLESARQSQKHVRLRRMGFQFEGISEVKRLRSRLTGRMDPRWLTPYERALQRYGRGLVAVRDRVCQGCFVTLPTSAAPNAGDTLTLCESCGRILYWR